MTSPPRAYVETRLGRIAYRRCGSGPPVVLIHGSLVTADDMVIALADKLAAHHEVIAFDRPGHGGSAQTPSNEGSPYAQAEMLAEAWTELGIAHPTIIGHSFGGAVALSLALATPDAIAGVLAIAPLCFPELRLEHLLLGPRAMPVVGGIIARGQGEPADLCTLPLLRNAMFLPQVMPSAYAAAYPFAWSSTQPMMIADAKDGLACWTALTRSAASYARCDTRIHIVGGTHDIVVANARHGFTAAQMLPNGTYDWISGAGHMVHHFHQDAIVRIVGDLVSGGHERSRRREASALAV